MAIEVFNRHENKYMLDERTYKEVCSRLTDYMEPDKFNSGGNIYTISNLYYDTPDSSLIRTSLSKPSYKEKLRVRAYGVPSPDDKVYVEIKKKVSGFVNKRRSGMTLREAYDFLASGEMPEIRSHMNGQVLNEISYILEQHDLSPALFLAYDRAAFFGIGQHDLRVSFDTNIRTRRTELALEAGDHGERLLEEGLWLMEIKVAQSIPLWLCRLLSDYKIYPTSFSKYGNEYKKMLADKGQKHIFAPLPQIKQILISA